MIVEDDGVTNAATRDGVMTEIIIEWYLDEDHTISFGIAIGIRRYSGRWQIRVEILGRSDLTIVNAKSSQFQSRNAGSDDPTSVLFDIII